MSTELQKLNEQKKLAQWAERITECRNSGLTVKTWCKENGVGEQSYYKWQRRVFAMVKAQTETQFAAVTPLSAERNDLQIAVTVQTAGITADIHNGADPVTVEAVLRILKLC